MVEGLHGLLRDSTMNPELVGMMEQYSEGVQRYLLATSFTLDEVPGVIPMRDIVEIIETNPLRTYYTIWCREFMRNAVCFIRKDQWGTGWVFVRWVV